MTKQEILKKYFGYETFRPGQETLIDAILRGQDVLGIMPTGAGKSLIYQVPALMMKGITLVISPLISLMKDQVQSLNEAGVHAAYINSSLSENQIGRALQFAAQGRYQIIYVAPERLETWEFMEFARRVEIAMVTVDEAHCISQWGQDFRPSYLKIVSFVNSLSHRPVVSAFTATATEVVKEDIGCVLGLHHPTVLVTGFDRENLFFGVERPRSKEEAVVDYVQKHPEESGIIYCSTRKNVETVAARLQREEIAVTKYHAGLGNEERRQNQEDFIYDRKPVIVATNAFGMGIDKSNVRYVLHFNMPQSLENYYQEAGRAGRDGEAGECILFYSPQDVMINRFLIESKEENEDFTAQEAAAVRERDEERLRTMTFYCTTTSCLRAFILHYFGEKEAQPCGHCSNCLREYEVFDVTKEAKLMIDCVRQCRQRYGLNVICGTLHGNKTAKLREYGMDTLPAYGVLSQMSEYRIKLIAAFLIEEGILAQTKDRYAIVKLTAQSQEVLEDRQIIEMRMAREEPVQKETAASSSGRKKKQQRFDVLNSRGIDLFESLRALRLEIAREEGKPPYIIFNDRTLVDLCVKLPFDKAQMLEVSGVGENKYERYGERFLDCIREFTGGSRQKLYYGEGEQNV